MVMPTESINSARSTASAYGSSSVTSLKQRMAAMQSGSNVASTEETPGTPPAGGGDSEFLNRLLAANPQSAKEVRKLLIGMKSEGKQYMTDVDKLKIVGSSMMALKEAGSDVPEGLYKHTSQAYTEIMAISYFTDKIREKIMSPKAENGDVVRESW